MEKGLWMDKMGSLIGLFHTEAWPSSCNLHL